MILKRRTLLYHALFWTTLYLLWIAIFRSYSVAITQTMAVQFCYLVFITIDYYAISYFTIPRFLQKGRYPLFVLWTLSIVALSAWLRALVAVQMNLHFFSPDSPVDFDTLYIYSLINILIWVLIITLARMLIDRIETQRLVEALEKEKVKSELDYLKAQINPHALFNSLNTIYGHIDKSNQVARNILLQFSELLRYQLYDCIEEKINLEREIEYIRNYVAFHRLRKDENLQIVFQTDAVEPGLAIAPLLLVVPIENAFKFVSNFTDRENRIGIHIDVKSTVLHGTFMNTREARPTDRDKNANGIGLANLKRRLELLYPNKHELVVHDEGNLYQTRLTIELS